MSTDPEFRARDTAPEQDGNLLQMVNVLLRRRRLLVGFTGAAAALAAIVSLVLPPTYTATTSFVPEVSPQARLPAGLAGIAGQLGLSLGAEAAQSPRFYADVVRSRGLMEQLLVTRFANVASPAGSDSTTLLRLLKVRGKSPADSLAHGVKEVSKLVGVQVDNLTNIVTVSVDSRYPSLAADAARRIIVLLNAFNASSRQSQARERASFIASRLAEAEQSLRQAEDALKHLYLSNAVWQQSPELTFEEGRLRRQVDVRQEVFLTLNREYESARIEEVNDTPGLTVVDSASVPQERARPRRFRIVLVWAILGLVAGIFWAFGTEYLERAQREDVANYDDFRRLLGELPKALATLTRRRTSHGDGHG